MTSKNMGNSVKHVFSIERVSTGHRTLDVLLEGGYPVGRVTTIEGPDTTSIHGILQLTQARVEPYNPFIKGMSYAQKSAIDNVASVVYSSLTKDECSLARDMKFAASVRLWVEDGTVKVIKNSTSACQGQVVSIDLDKADEEIKNILFFETPRIGDPWFTRILRL